MPSFTCRADGMNFPFICIPRSAGRAYIERRDYPDETMRSDPQKYVTSIRATAIQIGSNRLSHYGSAILDRDETRPTLCGNEAKAFYLQKRSESIRLFLSSRCGNENDCTRDSYGAMENTKILSLFTIERICWERRLIFHARPAFLKTSL